MDIEKEISAIKNRNERVEADKAWEKSVFRMILVSVITYLIVSVVFYFIGVKSFLLSALVPTIGYMLSTITIPFVKKWWIRDRYIANTKRKKGEQ